MVAEGAEICSYISKRLGRRNATLSPRISCHEVPCDKFLAVVVQGTMMSLNMDSQKIRIMKPYDEQNLERAWMRIQESFLSSFAPLGKTDGSL